MILKFLIVLVSSPRDPPKKERMAKVNKMEKQVNNLEKHVAKESKVRYKCKYKYRYKYKYR